MLVMGWLAVGFGRADERVVQTFSGNNRQATTQVFTVGDSWEIRWGPQPVYMSVTVLGSDGAIVAGASAMQPGSLYLPKGGSYQLVIHRYADDKAAPWELTVVEAVPPQAAPAPGAPQGLSANYAPPKSEPVAAVQPPPPVASLSTNAAPASAAAPPVTAGVAPPSLSTFAANAASAPGPGVLTESQARAVVVVKGDVAEGTGFLVHGPDGPAVVTNLHVLSANPNVNIFTTAGEQVKTLGLMGASDRDLAMILIQDNHYSYLDLATDIANSVQNGDPVITPGNSEGGEVLLDTKGTVLGVGPERIEFSNPIYHGNSGGPVFDLKTGKVIAVVTQALKVRTQDELDKASFENKDSAITSSMRYFGYRLDTVPLWEKYDWNQFLNETTFINNFHDLSRCLDSFMNGAQYEKAHLATSDEYGPPNALYYMKNPKIEEVHDNYHHLSTDADDSQRLDASREVVMDLEGLAGTDLTAIQNPGNFYAFDQIRVQQEIKYRQALEKEIENLGDKISDLGH